jgi:hypothetical protein
MMKRWFGVAVVTAGALLGFGARAQSAETVDCAPADGLNFVCGAPHAEDIVQIPGTSLLITSAFVEGGGINLVDARTKKVANLWPGPGVTIRHDKAKYGACAAPDPKTAVMHGLSIRPAAGGHYTLYAVLHGGGGPGEPAQVPFARESVEVFDVAMDGGMPKLTWVGCLMMPGNFPANSVAAFKDGTLLVTVMLNPGTTFADGRAGRNTGGVYQWVPGSGEGLKLLPGTELPVNNGIDTSPNEEEFFVVALAPRKIVAFSRKDPSKPLREAQLVGFTPDNVRMTFDGKLITAGSSDPDASCTVPVGSPERAKCLRGYIAAIVDPKTMAVTELARGKATAAYTGATFAWQVGNDLWIGTHNNDKLAYQRLK